MENKDIIRLIDKYLAGECNNDEIRAVEAWYELQTRSGEFYNGDIEKQRASKLRSITTLRMKLHSNQVLTQETPAYQKKLLPKRLFAAASVFLLLAAGLMFYFYSDKEEQLFSTIKTGNREIKYVRLPDSTQVWLNAGSSLRYHFKTGEKKRDVYLDGEAFFDVTKDKARPFTIHSGKVTTRVLGTAFSVSSYAGATAQTVTVIRGKVQVTAGENQPASLLPDQQLEFNINTGKNTIGATNAAKITSWTSGKLAFINMPMQDIAVHLQKWYGVKFIFKNERLKSTRLTASFDNSISLPDLLAIMNEVSHVRYRIDLKNKVITYL